MCEGAEHELCDPDTGATLTSEEEAYEKHKHKSWNVSIGTSAFSFHVNPVVTVGAIIAIWGFVIWYGLVQLTHAPLHHATSHFGEAAQLSLQLASSTPVLQRFIMSHMHIRHDTVCSICRGRRLPSARQLHSRTYLAPAPLVPDALMAP